MEELFNSFQPTITQFGLSHFGLSLKSTAPCLALQGVVHSYLQISAEKATPYPVIPDGTQSIFISSNGSIIGGAQNKNRDIQILAAGEYFGIRFYSGALRHFFNLDLSEITDQFVSSEYLPCKYFADLHQRIYQQKYFEKRIGVCDEWLLQHYQPQKRNRFDQALSLIYQSSGNIKVDALAKDVAWSSRHLNRLFQLNTGLSTKSFIKIIRLQNLAKQLYVTPGNSLDSALSLGYFDQSHLIKETKKHLLLTPSDFVKTFMSDFYN